MINSTRAAATYAADWQPLPTEADLELQETNNSSHAVTRDEIRLPLGRLQPISGWPLKRHLGLIEQASPGFLWKVFGTRHQWRQAAFAAFSTGILDDPDVFLNRAHGPSLTRGSWCDTIAEVGATLLRMRPREIVEAAFGSSPDGYLGALEKCGFDALSEDVYARLHAIYASNDPAIRLRKRCLTQLPDFKEGYLAAVEKLDQAILSPTIIKRHPSMRSANRLNEQVAAVRLLVSTADDNSIRASLESDEWDHFPGWIERWLRKADKPLPRSLPTDDIDSLERITPATARKVGMEFENCLGRDPECLSSRMILGAFAMVAWRDAGLLIEMVLLDDNSWIVRRVHARKNGEVTKQMLLNVRSMLEPLGITVPISAAPPPELAPMLEADGSWRARELDLIDLP